MNWRLPLAWGVVLSAACAQQLLLERADLPVRFVTAGERFRIVVRSSGLERCYGVGFRLQYAPAGMLRFAGWSSGEFEPTGVLVREGPDSGGFAMLDVAAVSLVQPRRNPEVVRLEFVLAPDAPHGASAIFRFLDAWALVEDTLRWLPAGEVAFAIHGVVEVWPGDANNDGIVDSRDVAVIGRFARQGITGYRRSPASVEWRPQPVRAWALPEATYADCDGNGAVGVRDLAVVLYNYGLQRGSGLLPAPPAEDVVDLPAVRIALPGDARLVVGIAEGCGAEAPSVRFVGGSGARCVRVREAAQTTFALELPQATQQLGELWLSAMPCQWHAEYLSREGDWRPLPLEMPSGVGTAESAFGGMLPPGTPVEVYTVLGQRWAVLQMSAHRRELAELLPAGVYLLVWRTPQGERHTQWIITDGRGAIGFGRAVRQQ